MDQQLLQAADTLGSLLKKKELRLATAESCTAGLVAMSLGAASGSSAFFTSGFVTYCDSAKHRILNVREDTLKKHSTVSEETVREMVVGAQHLSGEAVSLAISGYAGPDGGDDGTPAGTVWFAWGLPGERTVAEVQAIAGPPETVIHTAALYALRRLTALLSADPPQ